MRSTAARSALPARRRRDARRQTHAKASYDLGMPDLLRRTARLGVAEPARLLPGGELAQARWLAALYSSPDERLVYGTLGPCSTVRGLRWLHARFPDTCISVYLSICDESGTCVGVCVCACAVAGQFSAGARQTRIQALRSPHLRWLVYYSRAPVGLDSAECCTARHYSVGNSNYVRVGPVLLRVARYVPDAGGALSRGADDPGGADGPGGADSHSGVRWEASDRWLPLRFPAVRFALL